MTANSIVGHVGVAWTHVGVAWGHVGSLAPRITTLLLPPRCCLAKVQMTTTDWDECGFWLSAVKRMIKMRHQQQQQQG